MKYWLFLLTLQLFPLVLLFNAFYLPLCHIFNFHNESNGPLQKIQTISLLCDLSQSFWLVFVARNLLKFISKKYKTKFQCVCFFFTLRIGQPTNGYYKKYGKINSLKMPNITAIIVVEFHNNFICAYQCLVNSKIARNRKVIC